MPDEKQLDAESASGFGTQKHFDSEKLDAESASGNAPQKHIDSEELDAGSDDTRFLPPTLSGWINVIAKLGAIFLVGFGVFEYLEGKSALRISRTQELMKEYAVGPVGDARRLISQTLQSNIRIIEKLRAKPMSREAATAANTDLVHFLVTESRDAKGLAAELDTLLEFYERLVVCVEYHLCDADITRAYFQNDARWTFSSFRPYILERRENSSDYAAIAERLTTF
jgi:hypothetical protein